MAEITGKLQEFGYRPVQTSVSGCVVYVGKEKKIRGLKIPRAYAVSEDGLLGWPVYHNGYTNGDPADAAIMNLQGKERFLTSSPFFKERNARDAYLLSRQRRFLQSLKEQK